MRTEFDYSSVIRVSLDTSKLDDAQARRLATAYGYFDDSLAEIGQWVFRSREVGNFTYDLGLLSREHLIGTVAAATETPAADIERYIDELYADTELQEAVVERAAGNNFFDIHDATCLFGRRIGWYAAVRALKPKIVVETGVDKGLGSITLCAALLRNAAEGHPGRYFGTDLVPAGYLLHGKYEEIATILRGDSIESLKKFLEPIDFFINDSDHSADYEYREYRVIESKLADGAIVLGDNAHCSQSLYRWSREQGREFLFYREMPLNHWYVGAGIGFSFVRKNAGDASRIPSSGTKQANAGVSTASPDRVATQPAKKPRSIFFNWPEARPDMKPFRWILDGGGRRLLSEIVNRNDLRTLLEVGVFLGGGSLDLLDACPKLEIYGLDPYENPYPDYQSIAHYFLAHRAMYGAAIDLQGMTEDQFLSQMSRRDAQLPAVISNLWDYRDRFHLVRGRSPDALRTLHAEGVQPDIVFLDADKSGAELPLISELWPQCIISGDDWTWQSQQGVNPLHAAVRRHGESHDMSLVVKDAVWVLEPIDRQLV
jgi:predicted O-methyltransferase YrrM